jgi:uncharacterized damage-inducible protein DinB
LYQDLSQEKRKRGTMQAAEISKLENRLSVSRARLLASVADLDEPAWEWRPEDGRWSIRLTLAHVGIAHWGHLDVARHLAARLPVGLPQFDLDAWNEARVAERATWSRARILADMEQAQQETLSFVRSLEPGQLALTGAHPVLGETTVGQVLKIIAFHDGLHRRDVLRLLREMGG